jgi:hypothetical protein
MKKTYINPTCKVRSMKVEAILANTIIGGGEGEDIGSGGPDGEGGAGADANFKSVWDTDE